MKSNTYLEQIKNIPIIFKWKHSPEKHEFLIENEKQLMNFDRDTVARLKRRYPMNSGIERKLLKMHRRRKNPIKYGVLFTKEEKQRCNFLVRAAKQKGFLEKRPCEICGNKYKVCAHHEDYRKPFEIIWLCHICHRKRHKVIDEMIKNGTYTQDSIASKLNRSYGKDDEQYNN